MTMPNERRWAVENAGRFLVDLLNPKQTPRVPSNIRKEASRCLKHYPLKYHMELAAEQAPQVFGEWDAEFRDANKYFVVEALRWGDRENHSYVVGVFDNLHDACEACVVEELWRGGKYECVINNCNEINIEIQKQKEELLSERDIKEFNLEVQKRVDQYYEQNRSK